MGGLSFVTKTLSHKLKASRFVPLPYPVLDTGIFPTALSVSSSHHLAILASRNVDSLLVRWGVEQAGERQGTGGVKEITGASGEAGDRQIGGGTEVVVDEVERVGREGGAGQAELRGSEPGNGVVREKYEKMNGFLEVGKEGEEEKLLYGEVVEVDAREEGEEEVEEGGKVNVKVLDALVGLGPLVSGDAGAGGGQVVCCGGRGGKGELIRGERGIGAELLGRCKVSDLRVGGAGIGDSKGVSGLWVLPSAGAEEVDEEMNSLGGFVLASVDSRTECYRYLGSTVEREMAVDTLGFEVAFQTWAVGGIGGGRGLVQVYGTHGEGAVRLIWEGVPTQELPLWDDREVGGCGLPPGAEIAGAEVCDPYVLIVTRQGQKAGQVTLLRLEEEEGELVPVDLSGTLPQASLGQEKGEGMTAACLFHWGQGHGIDGSAHGWVLAGGDEEGEGDEEEGFLYAEESSAPRVTVTAREDGNDTQEGQAPMDVDDPTTVQQQAEAEKGDLGLGESIYLALALFSGSLDIYHLPTLRHVFHGSQLNFGPQLLRNFLLYPDLKASRVEPSPLHVTALRICTIGSSQPELQCLVLCAYTSDHTFLLYTPRPLPTPSLHPLPFSFLRLSHDHLTQIPRRLPDPPPPLSNPIFAFTDLNTVAGQRGLFLAGHNPAWILCERGVVIIRQARLREAQAKTGMSERRAACSFAYISDFPALLYLK